MLERKRGRFRGQQMDSGGDRGAVLGLQLMRRGMRTGLPRARRERGRAGASERMRKRRALHRRLPRGRNSHGLGSDGGRPDDRSMAAFRRAGRETWVRSRSLSVSTVCILQHAVSEPPGAIVDALRAAGLTLELLRKNVPVQRFFLTFPLLQVP